jgi:hypothetical protein
MASKLGKLLGFGFLIGAKDDGATKTTEKISEGFDKVSESVEQTGRSSQALQRFGNALSSINVLQLSRISGALDSIADRAGALPGVGETTELESFGAQFSQTYRAATAGLGEFRGAVDAVRGQISSAAHTFGVDAEGMIQSVAQLARSGHSLEDFGLSVRALAGAEQAQALAGVELANVLTGLSEGYDLGAEGAGRLLDTVTAIGERVGSATQATAAMPQVMQAIDEAAARFPGIGQNVDTAVESIMRLAAAEQQRLGVDFGGGIESAIQAFTELAGQRREMEGLITGLSSDFPDLARDIGIASGDIGGSIEAIMSDPVRFAAQMQELYSTLEPGSAEAMRLRAALEGMGPAFGFLVQGGERSQAALEAATASLGNTEGAFNRVASSAAGSSRTFADRMEALEDVFKTRLNAITRRHYPDFEERVLTRQREAYQNLGDRIDRFTSGSGPLATLGRSFRALQRGGVAGLSVALEQELKTKFPALGRKIKEFLPMLDGLGSGFFEAATQAGPMLIAMEKMKIPLPNLGKLFRLAFNPITLVAGGFYLLYKYGHLLPQIFDGLGDVLTDFAKDFSDMVKDVDFEEIGRNLFDGILEAFTTTEGQLEETDEPARKIGRAIVSILRTAWGVVRDFVGGFWQRIVEWVTEPATIQEQFTRGASVAGVAAGTALGVGMLTPFRGALLRTLGGGLIRAFGGIGKIFKSLGGSIFRGAAGGIARGGLRATLTKIPYIGAILGVLFDLPEIINTFDTEGIGAGINRVLSSITDGLLLGIPSLIDTVTGTTYATDLIDWLIGVFNIEGVVSAIEEGDYGRAIGEALLGGFKQVVSAVFGEDIAGEAMEGALENLSKIGDMFSDIWDAYTGYAEPIWDAWMGAMDEIGGIFSQLWSDTISPLLDDIKKEFPELAPYIEGIKDFVSDLFDLDSDRLLDGIESFGNLIDRVKPRVVEFVEWFGGKMTWLHENVIPFVVDGVKTFADRIRTVIGVVRVLARIFKTAFEGIVRGIAITKTYWEGFKEVLGTGFQAFGATIRLHLLTPFLNVRNTWMSVVETLRAGFTSVKMSILEIMSTILNSIRDLANSIPGLSRLVGPGLGEAADRMSESLANTAVEYARITSQNIVESHRRQRELEQERANAQALTDQYREQRQALEQNAVAAGENAVAAMNARRQAQSAVAAEERAVVTANREARRSRRTQARAETLAEPTTPRERTRRREETRERLAEVEALRVAERAVQIANFGPTAVRQLQQVCGRGGGGGGTTRSTRRPRPSQPGGSPGDE